MEFLFDNIGWLISKLTGLVLRESVYESLRFACLVALIALAIDMIFVGWSRSSLRTLISLKNTSVATDIWIFVLTNSSLSFLFGNLATFGLSNFLSNNIFPLIKIEIAKDLPTWLHFLLFFVVFDFLAYWKHRLAHTLPFLWQLHRLHHSATEMTVITNHRNHPIEVVISSAAYGLVAALLGVPPETLFGAVLLKSVLGGIKHSNFAADWGWFGKYGLQSPKLHHIHHSRREQFFNKNFAETLSIWDVLFGTYAHTTAKVDDFGLDNDPLNSKSFVHDIASTTLQMYVVAAKTFFKTFRLP